MKNLVKKYSKLVMLIALTFIVAFYIQKRKVNKLKDQVQIQAIELSQLKDDILTYVTKNGQLISKIKSDEVDKRNLRQALEIIDIEKKDLKDQNIKLKNLVSVLQLEIESIGQGETSVIDTFYVDKITTDTIYYQKVNDWTDNYLSLFNAKIENQKFDFDYHYNVNLDLFYERERKDIIVTANLNNPNSSITTANSINIPTKTSFFKKPIVVGTTAFLVGLLIAK